MIKDIFNFFAIKMTHNRGKHISVYGEYRIDYKWQRSKFVNTNAN